MLILFGIGCSEKKNTIDIQEEFEWKQAQTVDNKFSTEMDSLVFNIQKGNYGYIDEVFISKNDTILFQEKFNLDYNNISKDIEGKMGCGSNMCKDSSEINLYNYYHPKYHPYYLTSDLHTLQSITKSVASTIIGTAIYDGKIRSVDESLLQYFTKYKLSDTIESHLESAILKDILTMQLGLEWKEFGMSLEMETNVSEMELSEDWITYTLNQSIEAEPGKKWNYNSGASQLLSQIINSSTGKTIDDYGIQFLFKELNIEEFYWKKTPSGLPDTESGLYLKVNDLAKIGLLYLQDGIWNGKRILPKNWSKEALDKQVVDIYQDGGKEGYGYQWWITGEEPPLAVGLGYGNQILVIVPEHNIVGVVYAWNVFDNDAKYIFGDFVDAIISMN